MAPLIAFVVVFLLALLVVWLLHGWSVSMGNPEPADLVAMLVAAFIAGVVAAGIAALIAAIFAAVAGIHS